ncbi:MAG: alpha/beta hydrolase [Alphaproteobacteria bacterium]|nr:alpha/beta hydrolase [Alphaproteobacteria bacterium]
MTVRPRIVTVEDLQPRFAYGRDGKSLRIATLYAPPELTQRGVCVLLHGQTEFIEKYLEVIGELLARGYTVATLDWRGQGGSCRALDDPLRAHIGDFTQYDSDLQVFMDKVVRNLTSRPPIALAHSMGAHILLRAMHDHPGQFSAAVLSAPMLRVQTRGYPPWLARLMCRMQNVGGRQAQWVTGMKARDPLKMTFADQLVTSDPQRFQRTQSFLREHPNLRLAGPTWGWLEAAYRSMQQVNSRGYPEAIATPTLVIGAGRDRIVDTAGTRAFARHLPNGRYEELAEAEHEILMENSAIRARFWNAFDAFIANYL